jgi:hypothetical protein
MPDGHESRGVGCQDDSGSGRLGIVRLVAVAGIPGGDASGPRFDFRSTKLHHPQHSQNPDRFCPILEGCEILIAWYVFTAILSRLLSLSMVSVSRTTHLC